MPRVRRSSTCINVRPYHPCKGKKYNKIYKLLNQIKTYLRTLKIIEVNNVFIGYINIRNKGQLTANCYSVYRDLSSLKGKKGIYIVIGNSCKLGCDNRSSIIYIGGQEERGQQTLDGRIGKFINEFKGTGPHNGAKKIKKRIIENNITQTCLYIIGLPLKDAHKDKVEKAEGCFQAAYRHFYLIDPCFVDQTKDPDFTIFQSISPIIFPDDARRTIQFILTTIDIFFRDCIQNC